MARRRSTARKLNAAAPRMLEELKMLARGVDMAQSAYPKLEDRIAFIAGFAANSVEQHIKPLLATLDDAPTKDDAFVAARKSPKPEAKE